MRDEVGLDVQRDQEYRYPDNRSFYWHVIKERKEKPLKKSCQNPVEFA